MFSGFEVKLHEQSLPKNKKPLTTSKITSYIEKKGDLYHLVSGTFITKPSTFLAITYSHSMVEGGLELIS